MFVYIIYSRSLGKYYTGHTSDLEDRLIRHNSGYEKYTKAGVPWELVWKTQTESRAKAMKLELSIKKRGAKRFLDNPFGV